MLEIDSEAITRVLVNFIKDSVYKNHFKNGILGVSGGLDSAVVLALAQRALGSEHTFALLMPYKLSPGDSLVHGKKMCSLLKTAYEIVDITPPVDAYFSRFAPCDKLSIGNKCARERMSVLYDFSVRKKALVIGTSNKSELLIGYSTLYGDSAAAFMPLGDLYKTQVFALADYLQIPLEIISKKPSADLWENQTDEGEIGISYKELDEILFLMVERRKKPGYIENMGFARSKIDKIGNMIMNSQFKRTMPPVVKLQDRAIGIDFRYLRDWNK